MSKIFYLFMLIPGRINFLQMGRWGEYNESTYRTNFEQFFPFLEFNCKLVRKYGSGYYILAFDPSFLRKSGKFTPYKSVFWSGCAQKALPGLEIGCCSVIDMARNTAYHLDAIPTPDKQTRTDHDVTLLQHYSQTIIRHYNDGAKELSNIIALDGFFAKKGIMDDLATQTDAIVISKLRSDANLRYLYMGEQTGKAGRPRLFEGKVNLNKLNQAHFSLVYSDSSIAIYDGIVWSVAMKRNIRIAFVQYYDDKNKKHKPTNRQLYYSLDLSIPACYIAKFYKHRFQQEFINREGKQYTGLNDGQSRSINKMDFHCNASATAINIAKLDHECKIIAQNLDPQTPFSMANVKTIAHNQSIVERIMAMYDQNPNLKINHPDVQSVIFTGLIPA